MLTITIPAGEIWDEKNEEFIYVKSHTIKLEHSLVSLSKWESQWEKPFYSNRQKTYEETLDYIRCMTITQNVDPKVFLLLTKENVKDINDYIEASRTATTFWEDKSRSRNTEKVTSELIYYWMIALDIPFECQKWHLNRLLTLIRICNIKNQPPKKMNRSALLNRNAALNAARRKKLNTRG